MSESATTPTFNRSFTHASVVHGQIALADNTEPPEEQQTPATDDVDDDGGSTTRTKTGTSLRTGPTRLREQIARRRYAKYQQERFEDLEQENIAENDYQQHDPSSLTSSTAADQNRPSSEVARRAPTRTSTFQRGRNKVKGLWKRRKVHRQREGDAQVDILFENQRGVFFLGKPYYSSQSLLNFDDPPWTTSGRKPSPVDVTNAQVPDPNWEWAWRSWYVDMSIDVDEHGWQYSFMFPPRFPWHGNHPLFLSFVRRRRWIRMRVRKHRHLPDGRVEGGQRMQDAHKLNEDYFTIHPTRDKSPDSTSYTGSGSARASLLEKGLKDGPADDDEDEENQNADIENIKDLLKRLKRATIDREKIADVLKYMEQGGQDVYYLADEIPTIMSLLVFENSRRQLVAAMLRKVDELVPEDHSGDIKDGPEQTAQKKRDLLRAVGAADEATKQLEYWSDIRYAVREAETIHGADTEYGWDDSWTGLDASGPAASKQPPTRSSSSSSRTSTPTLRPDNHDKGKEKAPSTSTSIFASSRYPSTRGRSVLPSAFDSTSASEQASRASSETLD